MAEYAVKACSNKTYRRNSAIVIGIVALFALFALVMMIYNFITAKTLFAISYLIALILAVTFVVIRLNSVFATYLATDRKNVYIKNWVNNFLPYDAENKIKLISEFVPAKTRIIEIPVSEIKRVFLGTKNFVKRCVGADSKFAMDVKRYEVSKDFYRKKTISSMDIIYFETYGGECCYMPIVRFNSRDVMKILQILQRQNGDVEIRVNSRDYRSIKTKKE